jgi:pyruvate kinase
MAARRSDGADRLDAAVRAAFAASAVAVGDLVVVVACHPVEGGGQLPTLRVVRVADGGASASP